MSKRILVVDDSNTMRMIVGSIFRELGQWQVETAADGQLALAAAARQPFDLVVTDINMPVMDGLSFVRAMRGLAGYAAVPVLVLTTEDDQAGKLEAANLGVYAWLHKPADPEALMALAEELMAGSDGKY